MTTTSATTTPMMRGSGLIKGGGGHVGDENNSRRARPRPAMARDAPRRRRCRRAGPSSPLVCRGGLGHHHRDRRDHHHRQRVRVLLLLLRLSAPRVQPQPQRARAARGGGAARRGRCLAVRHGDVRRGEGLRYPAPAVEPLDISSASLVRHRPGISLYYQQLTQDPAAARARSTRSCPRRSPTNKSAASRRA